jgi:hypothetical protein
LRAGRDRGESGRRLCTAFPSNGLSWGRGGEVRWQSARRQLWRPRVRLLKQIDCGLGERRAALVPRRPRPPRLASPLPCTAGRTWARRLCTPPQPGRARGPRRVGAPQTRPGQVGSRPAASPARQAPTHIDVYMHIYNMDVCVHVSINVVYGVRGALHTIRTRAIVRPGSWRRRGGFISAEGVLRRRRGPRPSCAGAAV